MRVCLISREYPPDTGWGGIGTVMFHLGHGLVKRGHDVHVVSLTGTKPGAPAEGGPTIHRIPPQRLSTRNGLFNFLMPVTRPMLEETSALWTKFLELHQQKPFDVIECPEHFADGIFPAVARIAPLVVRLHTPHSKLVKERFHNFEPTFDHRMLTILERVAMLTADVLVSPSEDLAGYVAADLNLPLDRIRIVRNPVDEQKFTPEGDKSPEIGGGTTVLFVGRLEARKGIHHLIRAVPTVLRTCPEARFVIIGADTQTAAGHGSVLAELKSLLAEHGGEQAVTFIPHIPLEQLPAYYRAADVCVLPSLYENAPMTAIEAMSCGKSVVASAAGGTKEYVKHEECGLVTPVGDEEALAQALIKLIKDPALRDTFGKNARARVLEDLTIDKMVERSLHLYELAASKFSARSENTLYPAEPDHLNSDLMSLIASLDKRLYEMMFSYSLRFRLQHWKRRAKELFLCK
jgi:glycosyltransferase involved in cell wall biosynthesis